MDDSSETVGGEPELGEFPICCRCTKDRFLAEEIDAEGVRSECHYCGVIRPCIQLSGLADRLHEILERRFQRAGSGESYIWESGRFGSPPGDPPEYLFQEIARIEQNIANDIVKYLSHVQGEIAFRREEDNPYIGVDYECSPARAFGFAQSWSAFRRDLQAGTRYFSANARRILDEIFGDLSEHKTVTGKPVIRVVRPTKAGRYYYRGRVSLSTNELANILQSPVKELGPPPSKLAKSGRMNASGISVFYGATTASTCIAEIRAPVGSDVIIGRFEVLRPIRLLDMSALTELYAGGSHFDPKYDIRRERAAFFKELETELTRPIMPQDQEFEYLPTQAVAEYLANCVSPQLDGILFRSAQTGSAQGRNVTLFRHACGVEASSRPPSIITRLWHPNGDDSGHGLEGSVFAVEEPSPAKTVSEAAESMLSHAGSALAMIKAYETCGPSDSDQVPVLRLDEDGIVVMQVKGVNYSSRKLSVVRVSRHAADT